MPKFHGGAPSSRVGCGLPMSDFVYPKPYDVIVIGAGHAGIEAALAAARLGCETCYSRKMPTP